MSLRADELFYLLATVFVCAVTIGCSAYMILGAAKLAAEILSNR